MLCADSVEAVTEIPLSVVMAARARKLLAIDERNDYWAVDEVGSTVFEEDRPAASVCPACTCLSVAQPPNPFCQAGDVSLTLNGVD